MLHAHVAEGVHRIEDAYTNWYLIEDDNRLTIVDAGVPRSWESLQQALRQLGWRMDSIEAVVLTHGHFDHIGFAERVRRELGVPVWVHENDVPLTHHPRRYSFERSPLYYFATQVQALPIVASFVRHRAFWPPPIHGVHRFRDGELDVPGNPKVVYTPGHTIGHVSLHLPERDAVIAGDAIVTLDPYTGRRGPRIVAKAATADSERALASLDALAATSVSTVLSGHGPPYRDGVENAVAAARAAGVA